VPDEAETVGEHRDAGTDGGGNRGRRLSGCRSGAFGAHRTTADRRRPLHKPKHGGAVLGRTVQWGSCR